MSNLGPRMSNLTISVSNSGRARRQAWLEAGPELNQIYCCSGAICRVEGVRRTIVSTKSPYHAARRK